MSSIMERDKMYTIIREIVRKKYIMAICFLSLSLCFSNHIVSQVSAMQDRQERNTPEEQLKNLNKNAPDLKKLLKVYGILPKGGKNSYKLAQEIQVMIKDKLQVKVDGSTCDFALLYAAFLQVCGVQTSVASDVEKCLLLFKVEAEDTYTVVWNKLLWAVIAFPYDEESVTATMKFDDALKHGKEIYHQLEQSGRLNVIPVYQNWSSDYEIFEDMVRKGSESGQRGDYNEAREYFEKAMEISSKNDIAINAVIINNLGNIYLFENNIDEAIKKYEQAIELEPGDPAIYLNLGVAYRLKWKSTSDNDIVQKKELKNSYEEAFNKAYLGVKSSPKLWQYLGINPRKEEDAEYSNLIYDAELRVTGEKPQWDVTGGLGQQPRIPASWRKKADEIPLPKFPWPPPGASNRYNIPSELFGTIGSGIRLKDVERKLVAAFEKTGYVDRSYYSVPMGFALVSRLEQFNEDGTSKESDNRWAARVDKPDISDFVSYIKALLKPNKGYYRVIVFIVTSKLFTKSAAETDLATAMGWLRCGGEWLPKEIEGNAFTDSHHCVALIYEFEKPTPDHEANYNVSSRITAKGHLEKSGIWKALKGE